MHRSHGLQGSLKRRYKHPSPTSINGYHTAKSSCRNRLQNGPRSLSRAKVGTRSAFGEKSHTRAHTAKQVAFWVGVVSLPSERFTRFGNPAWPGIRTANFAPFGSRSRVLPKNAESLRDSDALMRVAVPRRRGPAGLRNLFLLLSKLRLVHPALRTLCVYEVGVVSLPSACFACSRNAGRPLAKAANLPFSKVGWSSLTSAVQNVLDRCSLLMIDFKYQKSIINRPTKKGGPHGRLQTGRC